MVQDPGDLAEQCADVLGTDGDVDVQQLLNGEEKHCSLVIMET